MIEVYIVPLVIYVLYLIRYRKNLSLTEPYMTILFIFGYIFILIGEWMFFFANILGPLLLLAIYPSEESNNV